ncbi:UNVERIFIED_CONTAM: PIH1 domain-containing protein 2 [Siphonaria sp. JEL0065]|nr:PIH1 domain-containing protein 2 [Siphonaria sp. JEL0065]
MQKGSKIWKHLDELAATDPEGYKQFIKTATENATQDPSSGGAQSSIKPGFRIETKEALSDLSRVYHVNFAVTDKLAAPPADDPLNIPICISEIRTGEDKKSKVVDAIINPSVLEKCNKDSFFKSELINLVIDCVQETHRIKLSKRTNKIFDKEYKGPFGWDEKGRPLTDADIAKKKDVKVVAESAEAAELGSLKLPEQSVNLKPQKEAAIAKPVIEEVGDTTRLASWSKKNTSTHNILYVVLPNIKSQTDIGISIVNGELHISTPYNKMLIPDIKSIENCEAKFIRTSETLKLKIPMVHE